MKRDESQLKKSYTLAELNKMPDSELIDTLSKFLGIKLLIYFNSIKIPKLLSE